MGSASHEKRAVTEADIAQLQKLLSGTKAEVRSPSDGGYDQSIERWSRAAEKPAGVAIVPTSAQEVAIAVKFATEQGLDLAVKGGGHSTAGASSTDGGILIDLGKMRYVEVNHGSQQVRIQGGALWGDVDDAAWKHGLATVGGTVADTGVGGLTLGGGYGALSGSLGLVIDNMVSATVVLANGDIATASQSENPDLFWALRGAGQNFGVTTEFVLQAYPIQEVYMGTMLFVPTPENISKLVDALNDLYQVDETVSEPFTKAKGKAMSLLGFAKPPPAGGQTMILINSIYNGPEDEGREALKAFFDIGPVFSDMRMDAYPMCNKLVPTMPGNRSSMKGAAFVMPIRADFLTDVKDEYEQFIASCEDAAMSLVAWELYDPCCVVAGEEGSFANRGYHLNSLVMPMWTKPENDQKCRQFARDISNMFKTEIEKQGKQASNGIEGGASVRGKKGAVMLYGNYDQYDEISKDIFGSNYPRLQSLKAQYDPSNMFNKLFPITPEKMAAQ